MRSLYLAIAACVLAFVFSGCTSGAPMDRTPWLTEPQDGFGADTNTDLDKDSSFNFHRFWTDTVNSNSVARWTVINNSGKKDWMLMNVSHSSPKSWVCGCKYWNNENDELISNDIPISGPANAVRLSFYTRWKILAGDFGYVQYRIDGGPWITLGVVTNGQNETYPLWDKMYFELPDFPNEGTSTLNLRFLFTSDKSGVEFGWGIDDVSVYQRLPEPPISVTASDFAFGDHIQVDWQDSGDVKVPPDGWFVYRGDSPQGPFSIINFVPFGTNTYDDSNINVFSPYYYKVTAVKDFVGESRDSNVDQGTAGFP